ncbi:MAG: hypothetical protein KAI24_03330, partial [Planctomycetes bacterium]|nr:hypothetical protein [Planctomycetota bacterium]
DAVAEREPLAVLAARRVANTSAFLVDVRDPNERDARGRFVVVREHGRMVVDLVASAGLTARTVEASSSRETFEPRALTPADHDRIREFELSQPAGKPVGN